jgi:uroporphyrinogen decarboxylase
MTDRMTPRDRVLAALSHRQPDRVPFSWGFGPTEEMTAILERELAVDGIPWTALRDAVNDIVRCPGPSFRHALPEHTDIWGIRRALTAYDGGTYGEIAQYPLAGVSTVEEIARYPWPDPDAFDREGLCDRYLAMNPHRRKAMLITGGNPFEIYCWMTGLEEAIVNLLDAPEIVHAALARITGFSETMLARTLRECGAVVDLVFFADDLGSQTGLLISRAMYREMLQPYHRLLTACAAELAPHAARMIHSDGAVFDILPDLIDAGFTVFEAVQTDAAGMDPERLKSAYGDALSFHGGISVQQLLPRGDADYVRAETERLVRIFGAGGGYIAAPSHAIQFGTPVANVLAMLQGVLGDDDYAATLRAVRCLV